MRAWKDDQRRPLRASSTQDDMASELDVLLDRVDDPALRADLRRQIELLRARRRFGLVFEEHLPERVQLPGHSVRRGTRAVLRDDEHGEPREVLKVVKGKATVRTSDGETETVPVVDLVVVADFGEPIYPGLRRLGSLAAGGDKPAHVVIKGENHHVLEALQFTHAGKVDCIYIDPPYNTGARDWKYNNDYVDSDDAYRHSKWLAFMDRRLRLARELLNPDDSVLIVTIDEKEVHRLALLLEQLFPGTRSQMVTIVINAPGQARRQELARVEEHAFFLFFGRAQPATVADDLLNAKPSTSVENVRWESLLRSGTNSRRADRPALFYPVFIDAPTGRIVGAGDSKPLTADRSEWSVPPGAVAIWPLKSDGSEGNWRASPEYLRQLVASGHARAGEVRVELGRGTIWYLGKAALRRIETGEILVTGRDGHGAVQVVPTSAEQRRTTVKTVWNRAAHHAGWHGSALVRGLVPGRQFPFPKSLYAVEDALRVAVGDKTDAVILDFFAGSGTTTHAVMRLNRQDAGRRQSISVTNNEVSDSEVRKLRTAGHRPGDQFWEALGIFDHITRPRIEAAVTGLTHEGQPVEGAYKFVDEFPMSEGLDENVEFFELPYLDPEDVEISAAFEGVAPLLWLRAGGRGGMIEHDAPYYAVMDTYGVLFNPDRWRKFVSDLHEGVKTVFIVTDSPSIFAAVASELPAGVEAVRLYENYLSTFTLNTRRTVPLEDTGQ